jgi:hypothetical protein
MVGMAVNEAVKLETGDKFQFSLTSTCTTNSYISTIKAAIE